MRVVDVPPSANEPTGQSSHLLLPDESEYMFGSPQLTQAGCPAPEYLPATHAAFTLDPSHADPDGHTEHLVRAFPSVVPPSVNIPGGQLSQLLAPASEYFLSSPHTTHADDDKNVPGVHLDTPPPVHVLPTGHVTHAVRVVSVPPVVW